MLPCFFAIRLTISAVSLSEDAVGPWNLKKRESTSGHLREDMPYLLVERMKSSSTSSTHSRGRGR